MIPKIIHYCWFGGKPLPKLAKKCIESWRKYLPEYEIREWNESNFDVNMIPYTAEAYKMKKYAFVSDFVRLYVISNYGGLYFDTDVEIVRPIDDIIERGAFLGSEKYIKVYDMMLPGINPGLCLGAPVNHPYFNEIVDVYKSLKFEYGSGDNYGYKTILEYCTELMVKYGYRDYIDNNEIQYCDDVYIYPSKYFSPDLVNKKWILKPETRSIHHYAASWVPFNIRLKKMIVGFFPDNWYRLYLSIKNFLK